VLAQHAWTTLQLLDWATAIPAADEANRLASEMRQPFWEASGLVASALLAGLKGDDSRATQLSDQAETIPLPMRANAMLCGNQLARGLTALAAAQSIAHVFGWLNTTVHSKPPYSAAGVTSSSYGACVVRRHRPMELRSIYRALKVTDIPSMQGGAMIVSDREPGGSEYYGAGDYWFAVPAALMALLLLLALWYLLPLPLLQHVHVKPDADENQARGNRDAD
jgi:hypothetical protein